MRDPWMAYWRLFLLTKFKFKFNKFLPQMFAKSENKLEFYFIIKGYLPLIAWKSPYLDFYLWGQTGTLVNTLKNSNP